MRGERSEKEGGPTTTDAASKLEPVTEATYDDVSDITQSATTCRLSSASLPMTLPHSTYVSTQIVPSFSSQPLVYPLRASPTIPPQCSEITYVGHDFDRRLKSRQFVI